MLVRLLRASDLERATELLRPLRYHMSLSEAASRIADVTASDAHYPAVSCWDWYKSSHVRHRRNFARRLYSRSSDLTSDAKRRSKPGSNAARGSRGSELQWAPPRGSGEKTVASSNMRISLGRWCVPGWVVRECLRCRPRRIVRAARPQKTAHWGIARAISQTAISPNRGQFFLTHLCCSLSS